jgi:hypothetical protein
MKKLLLLGALCLLGCQEEMTNAYLMRHPLALKKEVQLCQKEGDKTQYQLDHCAKVMNAAQKLSQYIEEEQQDPEKFGEKMLRLQATYKGDPTQKEEIDIMQGVLSLNSPE